MAIDSVEVNTMGNFVGIDRVPKKRISRKFKGNKKGVLMLYGIGCEKHNNCFTCPLPDCDFSYTERGIANEIH